MEVSSLLSNDSPMQTRETAKGTPRGPQPDSNGYGSHRSHHREDTRPRNLQSSSTPTRDGHPRRMDVMNPVSPTTLKHSAAAPPKKVSFELMLDDSTKTRARIPMRVVINLHDTTESIIATVKNWYGIYEGHGISFEDTHGNTLIARYENIVHDMVIHVRIIPSQPYPSSAPPYTTQYGSMLPDQQRRLSLGEPFQMPPPHPTLAHGHTPSRPTSRLARKRSTSPQISGRGRSVSQQKRGSRPEFRSRNSSTHGSHHDDVSNEYSDSDGGQGSITGSKKARSEQFVSAEISLENVLQDGRRNRPQFDSSELPLFVPPQVPLATSQSSISPQRRMGEASVPTPFIAPTQRLFNSNIPALPSPYESHDGKYMGQQHMRGLPPINPTTHSSRRLRDRSSARPPSYGRAGNTSQGLLPTPDPTIASCISDEDVARQLIALGDAPTFSLGRTSGSTLDDAFSGAADVASSTGATSDSDEYEDQDQDQDQDLPMLDQRYGYATDNRTTGIYQKDNMIYNDDYDGSDGQPKSKKIKTKMTEGFSSLARSRSTGSKNSHSATGRTGSKSSATAGVMKTPDTVASAPVRKTSSSTLNFQHQLAADEEDLSSKPRCQRCRKSKKGCDRQRPCQRCKDAGIGVDGCVSEDEGNGRKGRYGRHMGVVVKKGMEEVAEYSVPTVGSFQSTVLIGDDLNLDKGKKRKR